MSLCCAPCHYDVLLASVLCSVPICWPPYRVIILWSVSLCCAPCHFVVLRVIILCTAMFSSFKCCSIVRCWSLQAKKLFSTVSVLVCCASLQSPVPFASMMNNVEASGPWCSLPSYALQSPMWSATLVCTNAAASPLLFYACALQCVIVVLCIKVLVFSLYSVFSLQRCYWSVSSCQLQFQLWETAAISVCIYYVLHYRPYHQSDR